MKLVSHLLEKYMSLKIYLDTPLLEQNLERLNMTHEEFRKACRFSRRQYKRLLNEKTDINEKQQKAIERVLGVGAYKVSHFNEEDVYKITNYKIIRE